MSRSQSKAEYGRFAHLFVGGLEWLLSEWQELTGGGETELHSHAASGGGGGPLTVLKKATAYAVQVSDSGALLVPTANDVVFTLPAAAAGLTYTVTMWSDLAHPVIVRPQPSEQIASIGEHTLAAGKGVMGDQWNLGNYAMQIGGVLRIVATGSGEPWLVDGVGGPGGGSAPNWTSEL